MPDPPLAVTPPEFPDARNPPPVPDEPRRRRLRRVRRGSPPAFPTRRRGPAPKFLDPTAPSAADELVLPGGLRSAVVVRWDDPLGSRAPDGSPELFGFNNDFTAYFPIGGTNSDEGLLWVNHEYQTRCS